MSDLPLNFPINAPTGYRPSGPVGGAIAIPKTPVYPAEDDLLPEAGARLLLPMSRTCVLWHG
jgi:hypothetical protein